MQLPFFSSSVISHRLFAEGPGDKAAFPTLTLTLMSDSDDSKTNNLSDEQLALLHQQKRYRDQGVDPTLVPNDWASAVERNRDEIEALEAADRPIVLDASEAGVSDTSAARDALEAMGRVAGKPAVCSKNDLAELDDARAALGYIVGRVKDLDDATVEEMSLKALLNELEAVGREQVVQSLVDLEQRPETGGVDADELSAAGGRRAVADLSPDEKAALEDLKRRREVMADRTPQHAETLEAEIAELLDADSFDEVAADVEAI